MMTSQEITERAEVVRQAASWEGTPYHHQADIRGVGVDCGMLLVRVFVDAGLVPAFDPRPYTNDWFLHRDEEKYLGFVMDRVAQVGMPLFGDVVVFRHGRTFSHGGVVIGWPLVIHASAPARCALLENIETSPFADKERRFFSYWRRSGK